MKPYDGGMVFSWGTGQEGQLGHGESRTHISTPRLLGCSQLAAGVKKIDAGDSYSAAVTAGGELFLWGRIPIVSQDVPPSSQRVWSPQGSKLSKEVCAVACGTWHIMALAARSREAETERSRPVSRAHFSAAPTESTDAQQQHRLTSDSSGSPQEPQPGHQHHGGATLRWPCLGGAGKPAGAPDKEPGAPDKEPGAPDKEDDGGKQEEEKEEDGAQTGADVNRGEEREEGGGKGRREGDGALIRRPAAIGAAAPASSPAEMDGTGNGRSSIKSGVEGEGEDGRSGCMGGVTCRHRERGRGRRERWTGGGGGEEVFFTTLRVLPPSGRDAPRPATTGGALPRLSRRHVSESTQELSPDLRVLVHQSGSDSGVFRRTIPRPKPPPPPPAGRPAGPEAEVGEPPRHHSSPSLGTGLEAAIYKPFPRHGSPQQLQCGWQPQGRQQTANMFSPLPLRPRPKTSPSSSASLSAAAPAGSVRQNRQARRYRLQNHHHRDHSPAHHERAVFSSGSSWRDVSASTRRPPSPSGPAGTRDQRIITGTRVAGEFI